MDKMGGSMENKIGLSEFKLKEVERKIVNLKFNLLDEYFTFNSNIFELDFLKNLHNFYFVIYILIIN